jgi:hypothetical protein
MRKTEFKKPRVDEGLADLADRAERDHEVQMARSDLYKIAKYGMKLHEMLKNVSEEQGLEGWVQSKITKAADYLGSVYHHLDYEMNVEQHPMAESKKQVASCGCNEDTCDHCKGGHTMEEVGETCGCCGNKIKLVAAEGKSPHKKGTKKYKDHMAAIHANEDTYKESLSAKLNSRVGSK